MANHLAAALVLAFFAAVISGTAQAADSDTIPDASDNCKNVTNQSQLDTNLDGYGNRCDADYDNDGVVGTYLSADYWILNNAFSSHAGDANWNPDVDCNDDGVINTYESATCWGPKIGQPPGASGLSCAGTIPCSDTDRDGLHDGADNCLEEENPDQADTNLDGYGNACDADYDNNGIVGTSDLSILSQASGSHPGDANWNPDVDCNDDGFIDGSGADYTCFSQQFGDTFSQTQPSGLACAGIFPCPCNKDVGVYCPCQPITNLCIGGSAPIYPQGADCSYPIPPGLGTRWSCTPSAPALDAPRVLVDTTHQEIYTITHETYTWAGTKFGPFAKLLHSDGMVLLEAGAFRLTGASLSHLLDSTTADMLVIAAPAVALDTTEIDKIANWVAAGHGLFVTYHVENGTQTAVLPLLRKFFPTIQYSTWSPGLGYAPYRMQQPLPPTNPQGGLNGSSPITCPTGVCPEFNVVHFFTSGLPICPVPATYMGQPIDWCPTQTPIVGLDPLLLFPPDTTSKGYLGAFGFCYGSGRVYVGSDPRMHTRQTYPPVGPYGFGIQDDQGNTNENEKYVLRVMDWLSGQVGSCPN